MLAKNVFFGVVVIGALYLSYQYLTAQKVDQEVSPDSDPQVVSSHEFLQTVSALQNKIDMLQQDIASLRTQLSSSNAKQSRAVAAVVSESTPIAPIAVKSPPVQKQETSEMDKRLLQQSQLRAIAEKHEVAALHALVK